MGSVIAGLLSAAVGLATGALGALLVRARSLRTQDGLGAADDAVDARTTRSLSPGKEPRAAESDPSAPRSALAEREAGVSGRSTLEDGHRPHGRTTGAASRPAAGRPLASPALSQADPIGPCNRKKFCLVVEHRLAELKRNGIPWSIVLARLDDYPRICHLHGSHAASLVLQAVSKFFLAGVREMDWVARLDSTTFAILLPGANLHNAQKVAERLRAGVAGASLSVDRCPLEVSIVMGTAEAGRGDDSDTLLHRAEVMLEESLELPRDAACAGRGAATERTVGSR